jgi:hypothetical protein
MIFEDEKRNWYTKVGDWIKLTLQGAITGIEDWRSIAHCMGDKLFVTKDHDKNQTFHKTGGIAVNYFILKNPHFFGSYTILVVKTIYGDAKDSSGDKRFEIPIEDIFACLDSDDDNSVVMQFPNAQDGEHYEPQIFFTPEFLNKYEVSTH